jgi:flagellar basal-body rod modification protein FlgD
VSITSISSTTGTTTPTASPSALLGKDDFLKLLVAQLKHQDPTNPTDMNGMTEQMTQFGILEQLTNLAKAGEATSTSLERTHAVELLGRTVSYVGADGATVEGVVERVDTSGDRPTITVAGRAGIDPKVLVAVR